MYQYDFALYINAELVARVTLYRTGRTKAYQAIGAWGIAHGVNYDRAVLECYQPFDM